MKKFVFLILHYYSINDTINCVNSIIDNYDNYEIVIVDNGSKNNTGNELKNKYKNNKRIHVLLSKDNVGFARGNNIGFKYIKDNLDFDFIIMINNDIEMIDKDFLIKINDNYSKYNFSVLGPKIILPNGNINYYKTKINTYDEQKKLIRYLYFRLFLNYLFLTSIIEKYRKRKRKEIRYNNRKIKNIVLHGSCLIFSKNYINLFDGLDDRTFLYCEEELLYIRLIKNKLISLYDPNMKVLHNENGSTNSSIINSRKRNIFIDKNLIKSNKILLKELK